MEDHYKDIITKNLQKLVPSTICGQHFLSLFHAKEIFCSEDLQVIQAAGTNYGQISKSYKFYEVLLTKHGSFDVLLEGLQETNQSGALELLTDSQDSERRPPKVPKTEKFSRPPTSIQPFVDSPTKTVLIINSTDCKITFDWIGETVHNCQHYSFHDFLHFISRRQTSKEESNNLSIINCENEDIGLIISFLNDRQGKFVIVGSFEGPINHPAHSLINEKIQWKDLSPLLSHQILQNIKSTLGLSRIEIELDNLEEYVLHKLINGETPSLFKDTIPDPIKYYIPRRLLTRYIIFPKLFSRNGPDIFLISGIGRHQLTELAAGKTTTISSDCTSQTLEAETKFVLLEDEKHFDKITEKNKPRPVHVLKHFEGTYVWVRSSGSIDNIQTYVVDSDQVILSETDFVKTIIDEGNSSNYPVCISDTPGMGKSVLLNHIAKGLQKGLTTGSVGFMVISELVEQTRKRRGHESLKTSVFRVVADNLCENQLGVAYFSKNKHLLKHFLLDGLDEVNTCDSDIKFAYKLLKVLREIFPDARIWITTRPHMFLELERQMNVLGYNMEAFGEVDQINFLKSFWLKDCTDGTKQEKTEKLIYFAKECLKAIKSKIISEHEQDIAGIPLQCLLIGEVFVNEANTFCDKSDLVLPSFNVKSVSDLYKQLMQIKFDKFRDRYDRKNLGNIDLQKAHIFHSICLLFPSFEDKFSAELDTPSLSFQDVLDVGIIESKNRNKTPRFIHRTFAEYFLAIFLLESFCNNWSSQKSDLFFNHVLETVPISLKLNSLKIRTPQFRHNVICYFVDSYLEERRKGTSNVVDTSMKPQKVQLIAAACAYGSFEDIFLKLMHCATILTKYKNKVYSENFVLVSTVRAGVKMSSCAYKHFTEIKAKKITEIIMKQCTLLHFAVARGKYSIVEHLIEKEGFREYLSESQAIFSNLMHECVQNSLTQDQRTLSEKSQIIRYLANIRIDLLTSRNEDENIPLLSSGLHVDLAMELLSAAKQTTPMNDILKFLHASLQSYSSEEYHIVLKHILNEIGSTNFSSLWIQTFESSNLLHKLFELTDPTDTMLDFLFASGINFSNVDGEQQESILETAINSHRSSTCIVWLLRNVKFSQDQIRSAFSASLTCANVRAVNIFLEGVHFDVKLLTSMGKNLWKVLFDMKTKITGKHYEISQKLIDHGKFLDVKNNLGKGPIEMLVHQRMHRNQEWWDLFELCFDHIHKTTQNTLFTKLNYFKRRESSGSPFDKLLDACSSDQNISKTDTKGNTLLHLIWKGWTNSIAYSWEIWKILVEGGSDAFVMNNDKDTAIWKLLEYSDSKKDWKKQLTTIIHLLENVQILETEKINEVIIATVRHCSLNVVERVLEWFTTHVSLPVSSITGNYKGTVVTLLDMTLLSRDVNVLEHLYKLHNCKGSSDPISNTCIHEYIAAYVYDLPAQENRLKFITVVTSIYPDLLNAMDEKGRVPLSVEIPHHGSEIVRHLLNLGANVNSVDPHGNTPLHYIGKRKMYETDWEIWKILVEAGANVLAVNEDNENHIWKLLENSDSNKYWKSQLNAAIHMLESASILETATINEIVTATVTHCSLNVVEKVVEWYIKNVGSPVSSIRRNYKGSDVTLLDITLLSGNGDVLEYLYKTHNCTWSSQLVFSTCIHKCIQSQHPKESKLKFITIVTSIYPDIVNATDEEGRVPLTMKIIDPEIVRHLVKLGANVNVVDPLGNMPLHWALKNFDFDYSYPVVEALVKCGADVNAVTDNQETPLILSLHSLYWKTNFNLLIENNADPGKQDAKGNTVLHFLSNENFYDTTYFQENVKLLLKKGYVHLFDLPNNENITPLQIALQHYPPKHPAFKLVEDYKTGK